MNSFLALSDPTRRSILEMLATDPGQPASQIYSRYQTSASAISQHLKVLRESGLVRVERSAQQRLYFIEPKRIRAIEKWVKQLTEAAYKRCEKQINDEEIEPYKATFLPFEDNEST